MGRPADQGRQVQDRPPDPSAGGSTHEAPNCNDNLLLAPHVARLDFGASDTQGDTNGIGVDQHPPSAGQAQRDGSCNIGADARERLKIRWVGRNLTVVPVHNVSAGISQLTCSTSEPQASDSARNRGNGKPRNMGGRGKLFNERWKSGRHLRRPGSLQKELGKEDGPRVVRSTPKEIAAISAPPPHEAGSAVTTLGGGRRLVLGHAPTVDFWRARCVPISHNWGITRSSTYYVYALKDPRTSPAQPFYIGKGTGQRAHQHVLLTGSTRKDEVLAEIRAAGLEPLVEVLISELDESAALKLEAELISSFGTEATGGRLTNAVTPSGLGSTRSEVTVPSGAVERAQIGLQFLLDAVLNLARANAPAGITNADVVHALGIESDHAGGSFNYLSYSLLGILMRERKVVKAGNGGRARYRAA